MSGGGIWLIAVGGSWYYGLAGLAMLVAAWLLLRRKRGGQILMAVVWAASLAWALWEVGFDGWGLVPRVVGITVLFMLALLVSPVINAARRRFNAPQTGGLALSVLTLAGLGLIVANDAPSIRTDAGARRRRQRDRSAPTGRPMAATPRPSATPP